ncbi:MAG: hypothetical protein ACRD1Y_06030, partial [Terriglobales bacterium]
VVRGGFGMFADLYAISVGSGFLSNLPLDPGFSPSVGLISPAESNSLQASAQAAYTALESGFNSGATLAQLQAAVPGFEPPNLTAVQSGLQQPTYYKWNLEVQQGIWHSAALTVGYTGNYGVNELMEDPAVNAYSPTAFAGLPASPVDPRFGQVTEYQSDGKSNYNGFTGTLRDNFSSGVLMLTYTWSHAFADGFGSGQTRYMEVPSDPAFTYGPADQDVRHSFAANYVWNVPFQQWFGGSSVVAGGWQVTGTFMARTGTPYSVIDQTRTNHLSATGLARIRGGGILANFLGGPATSCNSPDQPCLSASEFNPATTGFGAQQRDSFYGPGFWDTDMSLIKNFTVPGWESAKLYLEGSAYNLFNHPNFYQPDNNLESGQFGLITSTNQNASSILGDNGGDASVRLIQLQIGLRW